MEKINIEKMDGMSADIVENNIEELKKIFPEVFKEGKVDFDVLRDLLGKYEDEPEERFGLNWAGKANARREAQKRSTGTLRPCQKDSKDWDKTENVYIEGDNLEVLKLLQKSYHGSIKMIYIDPPYNTGKDFVYKDNYRDNMANYLELTGQDKKMGTNTESDGRFHSNWLNMMYPRLKLARNLLTDDGVIFISIDDNEVDNLKKVCNEIFGEENFVAQLIWSAGRKNDSKYISVSHEYIMCYVRNVAFLKEHNTIWREKKGGLNDIYKQESLLRKKYINDYATITRELKVWYKSLPNGHPAKDNKHYCRVDENGIYFPDNISWPGGGGPKYELVNPNTGIPAAIPSRGWLTKKETMLDWIKQGKVDFGEKGSVPCLKSYLIDRENSVPYSVFYQDGRASSKRIMKMFGAKVFENPKDEDIIIRLINFTQTCDNSIILDFFSGSATTAHAVMQLNAEDGGNRKYICVQIPEPTPDDSEAKKAGYNTIPEIAKERIRRAGKKIYEETQDKIIKKEKDLESMMESLDSANKGSLFNSDELKSKIDELREEIEKDKEALESLDLGFKVYKLDSSNLNAWDGTTKDLESTLMDSLENVKYGRSDEDILYEIMIKYGISLTEKINTYEIEGQRVYEMGAGSLIVCWGDGVGVNIAEGIGKLYKKVSPEGLGNNGRVVFKDAGFVSDEVKTNSVLTLRQYGVNNVITI